MTVSCTTTQYFITAEIQNTKINPRIMHILKLIKYNWVGLGGSKGGGGNWD